MEYEMGDEKIEQNVDRLRNFLFYVLGCSKKDVKKVIGLFSEKYLVD